MFAAVRTALKSISSHSMVIQKSIQSQIQKSLLSFQTYPKVILVTLCHSKSVDNKIKATLILCSLQLEQLRKVSAKSFNVHNEEVVYDRKHCFGFGPKAKLADTFGRYHNRNYILKGESKY